MTWSLPSQPARKMRSPAGVRATVGPQRIWSAIEWVQTRLPVATSRHESEASCEPTSTRGPASVGRIVGPPEISPSVTYSQRVSPVFRSSPRTMPTSSPTTTGNAGFTARAAAEVNPVWSIVRVQRVSPVARSSAWNWPSRSPMNTVPAAITGTAAKAPPGKSRRQASWSGTASTVADRPVPARQPRAIGQAVAGAVSRPSAWLVPTARASTQANARAGRLYSAAWLMPPPRRAGRGLSV